MNGEYEFSIGYQIYNAYDSIILFQNSEYSVILP
jgi:hypothetical protein